MEAKATIFKASAVKQHKFIWATFIYTHFPTCERKRKSCAKSKEQHSHSQPKSWVDRARTAGRWKAIWRASQKVARVFVGWQAKWEMIIDLRRLGNQMTQRLNVIRSLIFLGYMAWRLTSSPWKEIPFLARDVIGDSGTGDGRWIAWFRNGRRNQKKKKYQPSAREASWGLTDWATRGSSLQHSPAQGGILNGLSFDLVKSSVMSEPLCFESKYTVFNTAVIVHGCLYFIQWKVNICWIHYRPGLPVTFVYWKTKETRGLQHVKLGRGQHQVSVKETNQRGGR